MKAAAAFAAVWIVAAGIFLIGVAAMADKPAPDPSRYNNTLIINFL